MGDDLLALFGLARGSVSRPSPITETVDSQ
jgi:hypothetical protein